MPEVFLGFDYGERRIGVAVGQAITGTATPLETVTVPRKGLDFSSIDRLVEQWSPDGMVVGIPLTESGEEQPMTRRARRFAGRLGERYHLPVHHADERYTSRIAKSRFKERRQSGHARRRDHVRTDAVAAQLILELWFAERTATC